MESRAEVLAKNTAELSQRPARQFIDEVSALLDETMPVLNKHSFIFYSKSIKRAEAMRSAVRDIMLLLQGAENSRTPFVCSADLMAAYIQSQEKCATAEHSVNVLESGEQKLLLEKVAAEAGAKLRLAQNDNLRKQNSNMIEAFRTLQLETARLQAIQSGQASQTQLELQSQTNTDVQEDDREDKGCCLGKKSKRNKKIAATKRSSRVPQSAPAKQSLPNTSPDPVKQQAALVSQATAKLTEIEKHNPLEATLQKDFDEANAKLHDLVTNYDNYLAAVKAQLVDAQDELNQLEDRIKSEKTHYYADVEPVVLQGILRIYTRFHAYKDEFSSVTKAHPSLAAEAHDYIEQLKQSAARLENLLNQLWSDKLNLTAKDALAKVEKADAKFLEQRPVVGAMEKLLGIAKTPSVVAGGIFNPKAQDKRASLEKGENLRLKK